MNKKTTSGTSKRLWDVRSGKIMHTIETSSPVKSTEVSQDGRYITTADGLVKSYDMSCTVESASLEPKHGNKFVAAGEDMWIQLFNFRTGEDIVERDAFEMVKVLFYSSTEGVGDGVVTYSSIYIASSGDGAEGAKARTETVDALRSGAVAMKAMQKEIPCFSWHKELLAMELAEEVSERKDEGEAEKDKHVVFCKPQQI
ncbi:hypothetical protein C5167_020489 [Papaver somniferum]|uniref:Uncharacterized protein n=1 Tax=Papaver somniferum TaxID=3469 RepID=A0A4Y7IXD0_PAPSO|nr:hypothetical protein C5167_020489 [Papaver somniferum]